MRISLYSFIFAFSVYFLFSDVVVALDLPRDPCALISTDEVRASFDRAIPFTPDLEANDSRKYFEELGGVKFCVWIAPALMNLDTGSQRNVAMVSITIADLETTEQAEEFLFQKIQNPYGQVDEVVRIKGLGDDAFHAGGLLVRKDNIYLSIRFAPYTRWPRTVQFIQQEGQIAHFILSKL